MTDVQTAYAPRRNPVQNRPGPPAKRRLSRSGGSPKVRQAINLMIWGGDDGLPLTRQDAAKTAGIAEVTLRNALANPLTMKTYNEQIEVLRTSKRARALHKIEHLSDHSKSDGVKLKAAMYLDGGDKGSGVNVQVNLNQQLVPGYITDVSEHMVAAHQILNQAQSKRNLLMDKDNVTGDEP